MSLYEDVEFEAKHPRDKGKFAKKPGAKRGPMVKAEHRAWKEKAYDPEGKPVLIKAGKRKGEHKEVSKYELKIEGQELPAHLKAVRLPPAWKDVHVTTDPESDVIATGVDEKGRKQVVYSASFAAKNAAAKFARVKELMAKAVAIREENDAKNTDEAVVTRLIMETGIRPGSSFDTGAEKQAYGATTLEGRHVKRRGGKVTLEFVGKKGVDLKIPVENQELGAELIRRAKEAGRKGKLFNTSAQKLRDHVHDLNGGDFKPKDFRTLKGTSIAAQMVSSNPIPPKDEKEYKARVREVAVAVSKKLGNTPTIALQSYIAPEVFSAWRIAI
jgi:DNA topoisomerase-1